ncbi:MAG: glycosyltransferase family 2 protein [Candidatus Eremiobacteraeota bacterium]|nr:glycosyltransferase family 2 protein [Candidatus Eremiobacteraeota bacterium]
MSQDVSVVVVSYNRREYVRGLLESIARGDLLPDEIIVVDNASRDGTVEMLARDFPGVRVIANRENFMGSYAVNQGIAAARNEFVYATADDNVIDTHCLAALRDVMLARPDAGLVAPVMYFYDEPERVWFAGCDLNMVTGLTRFYTDAPRDAWVETAAAPNCYMIRRSVLASIGGQDDATFPFHHEEADWSFRAAKIGFKSYVAAAAREWHRTPVPKRRPLIGSGDLSIDDPQRAYFHVRSRALLARRHARAWQRAAFFVFFFPPTVAAYAALCAVSSRAHLRTSWAFVRGAVTGLTMKLPAEPPPLLSS